ncbi:MAG: peptidoglycan bridge formation glycyltransferase FemA/FemB family protein, partial [Acidimicrobiaceae bacterium]
STVKWLPWLGTDSQWDIEILKLKSPCVYQSSGWSNHRANFGWKSVRLVSETNRCFAQVLYKSVFKTTVAWIPGGPLGDQSEVTTELVTAIQQITKSKRVYVRFNSLEELDEDSVQLLQTNNWHQVATKLSSGLSLIYGLDKDEPTRRNALSTNWGRNLRRGESRNSKPYLWTEVSADVITDLYTQLSEYKDLTESGEIPSAATIDSLINCCKNELRVIRCDDEAGKPLAVRGALIFGSNAWDIFAAVSPQGRKQYSSYVTAWSLLNHCAKENCRTYDLSGIDPVKNKGVYDFKHGTGATEIKYIGEWESGSPFFVQPIVSRLLKYRKTF